MEDFAFFSLLIEKRNENDDWRMRYVFHRTATGQRNKVRVKSLPKEQQWKYAPLEVKIKRQQRLGPDAGRKQDFNTPPSEPQVTKKPTRTFIVYYSADRPEGSYDKFTDGKLVMVTDDSAKAFDIEKQGHKVAVAHQVPIDAFKKYWNYEKKDWVSFPENMDNEKKFELINWTDNDVYLVDFFKFKYQIDFHLSDPEENVTKNEGVILESQVNLSQFKSEKLRKQIQLAINNSSIDLEDLDNDRYFVLAMDLMGLENLGMANTLSKVTAEENINHFKKDENVGQIIVERPSIGLRVYFRTDYGWKIKDVK